MTLVRCKLALALVLAPVLLTSSFPAEAHKLRSTGMAASVAASALTVTPSRDWNQLGGNLGKNTESWTLDGSPLNDVTFFAGIPAGQPLLRERSRKREPLPKFTSQTLLVEVPELLERTYRSYKDLAAFRLLSADPAPFIGSGGVTFRYEFTDKDELTRLGEARAAIVGGKLYMITFDAPRLNFYARSIADFRALADSARLR